ncbi:hypothetical protein GH714_030214 [Hevea brasiliensis]|uniref:Protein FAR1-RELATED SEQUENCE n=1 Tax=Hevea brasiliensis TaxID=3981 RepID=A0A6A6K9D8_HEVBR|nr:hypothetical protein GH714_030214 [Hevea brasiliensis]
MYVGHIQIGPHLTVQLMDALNPAKDATGAEVQTRNNASHWNDFSNVHNHELLEDDQVRLLPAYRKIQEADQERILLLPKAGFPVNRIVKVLELEKGVQPGQLPFIEKDVRNFVRTCMKTFQENDACSLKKRENDTLELLEACKAMVDRDADFAYDYTTDEYENVENIAWLYRDSVRAFMVLMAANFGNQGRDGIQYMHIKTCMPIEEHARRVLTPYAFNVLQHEIILSVQYGTQEMADGSYLVQHYKKMDGECLVIWIPVDEQIHCSCKEFDQSGILCRHSLRVLAVKNYFQLPEKYLPLRWRREHSFLPMDDQNAQSNSDECTQAFHSLAATLLTVSLVSKELFTYVHGELTGLLDHVQSMLMTEEFSLNMVNNNISES